MQLTKMLIKCWLLFLISFFTFSCLDSDQQPAPSILGKWEVRTVKQQIFVNGVEVPINTVNLDSATLTDYSNTQINFMSDGKYLAKTQGKLDLFGNWVLTADELKLILDKGTADEKIFEIRNITDNNLHLFLKKQGKSTNPELTYLLESNYYCEKI